LIFQTQKWSNPLKQQALIHATINKMNQKKLLKYANIGVILGVLVATLSFMISLVPCKKEAGIGVCTLPNPFSDLSSSASSLNQKYYFISNNPMTGLILQFLIPFAILLILALLLGKEKQKKGKFVDFTKK